MARTNRDVVWTIKVDESFDRAVQEVQHQLGFRSKAELAREAIREFLIRHRLYNLLGGETVIPAVHKSSPEAAFDTIHEILKNIPVDVVEAETKAAREEIEDTVFGNDS